MAARRTVALIAIVGGALVASVLAARTLLDLDRYRPRIVSYFEANSGKQTTIEHLALTFFPKVTVHIYGMGVKNPPPFPPGDVVKVAQADAVIDPWALLRGAVVIRSLRLEDLAINLVSASDGCWNFENPLASTSENTFPLSIIDSVVIERGQLSVSNLLPSGAVGPAFVEAHDINSELALVDLAAIVNPSSPSLNGRGTWQAARLRFSAVEATNVSSAVRLESWKVSIADVKANAYSGTITGDFSLNVANKNASVTADARMSGIELAHLLMAFDDERAKVTGRLDGDLKFDGDIAHTANPLAGLRGTGHVRVTSGQVPGLMSNADLTKLASFNDRGPAKAQPSSFASISADLRLADLWLSSKAIDIDGYGVDVDGAGRVRLAGSGELHYRGVATITTEQGFWTNTFARFGGAALKDGKLSFPFRIEGTIEKPKFSKATTDK